MYWDSECGWCVCRLVLNEYGVHVVLKMLTSFSPADTQCVMDHVLDAKHTQKVCCDKHGNRLVKELMKLKDQKDQVFQFLPSC